MAETLRRITAAPTAIAARTPDPSGAWRTKWLGLDESDPERKTLAMALERLAKAFFLLDAASPRLLVIAGRNGTGKTRGMRGVAKWATAVAVEAWHRGHWRDVPSCMMLPWSKLSECSENEREGVWRDASEANLLLLDDVGSEVDRFKSGLPAENLRRLLSEREEQPRTCWTIITTNQAPDSWAERWDKRVEDRLFRNSQLIELKTSKSWWRK